MKDLFQQLQEFASVMDLGAPLSEEEAEKYAGRLPAPLLELYKLFNGGEIFVPGTTIYGLTGQKDDVREINQSGLREKFHFPEGYLVFARLNFGDLMLMRKDSPFQVLQWDHEADEEFNAWDSLEDWLREAIEDYWAENG